MKKMAMIVPFSDLPNESGNCRFLYLCELLKDKFEITFITSSFSHIRKIQREKKTFSLDYPIVYIDEPGYSKNISIKRFLSHQKMAKNLNIYLSQHHFDIVYCAIPDLNIAEVACKYAKKINAKYVIDVQDLWPEAFEMIVPFPFLFYKYRKQANAIYENADLIVAVSETYAERVKSNNTTAEKIVAYLGTDLNEIEKHFKLVCPINKNQNEFWVAYVGTLGHSYDISVVIEAMKYVNSNIRFIVMGDGPLKTTFENAAVNTNTYFTGRLDYAEMISILKNCDVAVNPIQPNAAQSIINKVGDYAACGLCVINTQKNQEYCNLLDQYQAGFNVENNGECIREKIEYLYSNPQICKEMGKNNRQLAEDKFNRSKEYLKIVEALERL